MSWVLLLGGSGFIGRNVEAALHRGGAVVSAPSSRGFDLARMTVEDIAWELRRIRPTAVVNCTGRLDGSTEELMEANLVATEKLVSAIARTCPGTRYVRTGSAGEYGRVPFGVTVDESFAPQPVSPYGLSHLAATRFLNHATKAGDVSGCTVRVFNPIGVGMRGSVLASAIEKLEAAVEAQRDEIEMGPLHAHRDFVDVRDLGEAIASAAVLPDSPPAVVNAGSGVASTVREAVAGLARRAGFKGVIREEAPWTGRSLGVDWIRADVRLAEQTLGWRPQHDLESSLDWIWSAVAAERLTLAAETRG